MVTAMPDLKQSLFGHDLGHMKIIAEHWGVSLDGSDTRVALSSLVDSLLDKVLSLSEQYLGMSRIEFSDRPDLNDQVIIFGKDEAAVRDLLDKINLDSITRIKSPLHITGVDDFLTVDFSQMGSYSSPDFDLIAQHQEFSRILSTFTK